MDLLRKSRAGETACVYIGDLPKQSLVDVKAPGAGDGIELFPKQDPVEEGQFGNAIRAPLGIDRGAIRGYWFYGAPYELEAQMIYLRTLRRVTEQQLRALNRRNAGGFPTSAIHAGWNFRRSEAFRNPSARSTPSWTELGRAAPFRRGCRT